MVMQEKIWMVMGQILHFTLPVYFETFPSPCNEYYLETFLSAFEQSEAKVISVVECLLYVVIGRTHH